jgi:transposase-like protein
MLNFKGMRFPIDVILVCIRWYVAYPLSYRHLEDIMEERGVSVDHSSINRWAVRFLPLIEKMSRKHKRPVGGSWRMDETYIKVKGVWKYLYRAVDKQGKTVDFLLTAKRDMAAAFACCSLASLVKFLNSLFLSVASCRIFLVTAWISASKRLPNPDGSPLPNLRIL